MVFAGLMVSDRLVRFRPREQCAPRVGREAENKGENNNGTLRMV
nr:MAG TPA: hypothetical protein [Caudoviricetes sp.]